MKTESLKHTLLIGLTLLICAAVYLNFIVVRNYEAVIDLLLICDDPTCDCPCHKCVVKSPFYKCGESSTILEK